MIELTLIYDIISAMTTLYLVATPIGNLRDITLRAIDTLSCVDLILAEDTRKTKKLLVTYKIEKPLESFHEHNENFKINAVLAKLKSGKSIALVSDAGTPSVSDPGYKLVRESIREGIKIVPIPGPNAAITALVASGLPTDQFLFLGYFPKKKGKQDKILEQIELISSQKPTTIIFYESPYRVPKTLSILANKFPKMEVVIARELTKIHEEFIRGTASELAKKDIKLKGEFTLLLR